MEASEANEYRLIASVFDADIFADNVEYLVHNLGIEGEPIRNKTLRELYQAMMSLWEEDVEFSQANLKAELSDATYDVLCDTLGPDFVTQLRRIKKYLESLDGNLVTLFTEQVVGESIIRDYAI